MPLLTVRRGGSNELLGKCGGQGVPADCFDKQSSSRKSFKSIAGASGQSSMFMSTIEESSLYLDYSANTFTKDAPESLSHMNSPEKTKSPVRSIVPPSFGSDATGSLTVSEASEQILQKPSKPLLLLAQQRKWRDIYDILRNKDSKYKYDLKTWLGECTNRNSGQTALHLVIKHKPPCTVVILMIRLMRKIDKTSDPQSISDKFGTTPLHVAVAVGCKVKVIEELLCGRYAPKINPAAIVDSSDRYPLHIACSKQVVGLQTKTVGAQIISLLATAYPAAIFQKDKEGWTPKFMVQEYAYHKAMSKALAPAEMALMRQHGGNLSDLMSAVKSPPLPLAATGLLVNLDVQASVSSIGWDEDKYGATHEVPMYQTWNAEKREKYGGSRRGSSFSVSHSVTETDFTSCCTDQNVVPRRRSIIQKHPDRFL